MKTSLGTLGVLLAVAVTAWGCGSGDKTPTATSSVPDSRFTATSEPAEAQPVGSARESAEDAQDIVVVGRIGGSSKPFVDGVGAFTIVDSKVAFCPEEEGCPTPWDYCCSQNEVKENIALVKLVDAEGKPVTQDARELLNIKELSMVVVQGKAQRDAEGNLAIQADQVFVKP
ncbi:MAG: hypothetical protein WDZ51_02460 [Pirellulaceae bacterium]